MIGALLLLAAGSRKPMHRDWVMWKVQPVQMNRKIMTTFQFNQVGKHIGQNQSICTTPCCTAPTLGAVLIGSRECLPRRCGPCGRFAIRKFPIWFGYSNLLNNETAGTEGLADVCALGREVHAAVIDVVRFQLEQRWASGPPRPPPHRHSKFSDVFVNVHVVVTDNLLLLPTSNSVDHVDVHCADICFPSRWNSCWTSSLNLFVEPLRWTSSLNRL